jgi:pimeloyl-ACP methyl ester carboxylesterase
MPCPPDHPIDLLGHSMGGNVVTMYAGARPSKIRRLVNLEGFGMPATSPDEAPDRYTRWLDELRTPMQLKSYDSLEGVAGAPARQQPAHSPGSRPVVGAALGARGGRALGDQRRPGAQAGSIRCCTGWRR